NIMLQKRPQSMAERTRHRDALVRELRGAERGIPVHFPDDLFEVTERHLPDRVAQRADLPAAEDFTVLMHRFEGVAHAAFAEELGLTKIRIPAGTADPAPHHVVAARHPIDLIGRRTRQERENLVASRLGTPLVGTEAENPVVTA